MTKTIETNSICGRLRGIDADGLAIFHGVPFAAAPVGALRFKPPAAAKPWPDALDVTSAAPICPQLPSRLEGVMGRFDAEQSENCLTMDIWAPLPLDRPRPVLVWLHGGGYTSGAGSLSWYAGERLARASDIVVININYRVGALGYFFRPGLSDGNMGLLDQLQALQWIRGNAASFGGDINQITLMGQSGGAHSIMCMLAMPQTRSLVRRAILLSTAFGFRNLPPAEATANAGMLCASLGIDPDHPEVLQRLQGVPVEKILDAQMVVMRNPARVLGDPTPAFGPTATSGLPGGAAFDEAARGGARGIDVIIGTTADESSAFYALDPRLKGLGFDALPRIAEALFGESWKTRIANARRMRPGATALEALSDAQTANYFVEGSERFALAVADGGRRAWVYRFDWNAPDSGFGACHCVELPFVFGTFEAFARAPMLGGLDEKKEALSAVFRGAFARFIRSGSPNGEGLPNWAPCTRSDPAIMVFDDTVRVGRADLGWL